MLIVYLLLLLVGFAALIKGADFFVDGSSALAGNFHISKVIIGLTIVAMGTSAPKLAVSTSAALQGANEIALSNVVGSNIFNLLCVLGICAMIHPVPVERIILKRDIPFSIGISVLLLLMTSFHALAHGTWLQEKMEVTVGNVIGSNIFNILFILGVSSTIHPIGVNVTSVYDMIILIGISILAALFSLSGRVINRLEGAVMLLIYAADVVFAAIR